MKASSHREDGDMDAIHPQLFSFFLFFLQTSTVTANICDAPSAVNFAENNKVGDPVTTIFVQAGVILELTSTDIPFRLDANQLIATAVLDYENTETQIFSVGVLCRLEEVSQRTLRITILVENLNDNPPVFDQNVYHASANELSPIDTTVGRFAATDADGPRIFYQLASSPSEFKLKSSIIPEILVNGRLDYEKVKEYQLVLEAQDTPLASPPEETSFTATTTIMISILDVDNRPPWFQPCHQTEVNGAVVCETTGYTGKVDLDEQVTGVLPLKPGPLYAIDGDFGINEPIRYSFLSENEPGLFVINQDTGNITMSRPADVLEPIRLTVLAAQRTNTHQFSTTSVLIDVIVKSLHAPQFQRPEYEALITSTGSMAVDPKNNQPLQILATDDDYSATGGINPYITYSVEGSSDLAIVGSYLFMVKTLPEGTSSFQILAKDTKTDDTATARLRVEVNVVVPSGGFGVVDMAALGATLGVLLFVSLVVIGVLIYCIQKGKKDWKKIQEAAMFQNSLSQGPEGKKDGMQYTNEAFQGDVDGSSMGSDGPYWGIKTAQGDQPTEWSIPSNEMNQRSSAVPLAMLPDNTSDTGLDKSDDEKEVRPILTKERRVEEGYKSVWFKEDIDPNAKEEVVIIPDSREDESEEEDDKPSSSGKNTPDEKNSQIKASRVAFADSDLDSGLGVRMDEPADDSDSDHALNISL
ncbi:cadherin-related family member 5 isoform X2 [Nothobranchius furzeri]|uniref:Cadherin-related family member 5-like n=1 Tax=Nothobranchius furzeri TaxID=105023 RepID=A0A8C6VW72_NOTFU|nr:cadherin-related family member 5 isoform X2 [Nothobranchius furzeri]KAF7216203.1 transcript variant X2 [Nothobranchius furzeri]